MKIGALEAGGTKMVCAIGDEYGRISEQIFVPTTTPDETMPKIIEYFRDKGIEALGIASFGPVDVNKESPTYGYLCRQVPLPRELSGRNGFRPGHSGPLGKACA